jgi:hypothetical protein
MDAIPQHPRLTELRQKLAQLTTEIRETEDELAVLESDGQLTLNSTTPPGAARIPRTPAEKVALFLELFATRRSVYPKRWENPYSGKSGYSPVCDNDRFARPGTVRHPEICRKPEVKCAECLHQKFPSLDARAVEGHLRGTHTLGVYAIGTDDTCRFLAADFDGEGFDLPRLDTLVLSMPLSFKGRLIQYAGRLNRRQDAKGEPLIFDYLDDNHAITHAMFRRRSAGYQELGYRIEMLPADTGSMLFGGDAGKPEISGAGTCGIADAFAATLNSRPS